MMGMTMGALQQLILVVDISLKISSNPSYTGLLFLFFFFFSSSSSPLSDAAMLLNRPLSTFSLFLSLSLSLSLYLSISIFFPG
jgi:hypothetical protein